ncbi:MAG: tRNA lysidine(34) synthetase TilS, partial [Bacteroidia bacterium]|nr:tRNA lysidine(34) synthetase TilS [Bacteroidia bacterium]
MLVAVSGGVDSVVLIHLLYKAGYNFAIAHCNFSLRLEDADADEKLVLQLSEQYNAKCFTIQFDTLKYARKRNLSVQMAARELRYKWFEELMQIFQFDYLLTAHHLNDRIETLLLNQIRGTGIKGLKSITEKQNRIVRPLLPFTKEEILQYAKENELVFREDVSNYSDKYQRNYIRLNVLPALKGLQPNLEKVFLNNIQNFSEAEAVIDSYVRQVFNSSVIYESDGIRVKYNELQQSKHIHLVFHYLLSSYGFNDSQIKDIVGQLNHPSSGKKFYSPSHVLIFDRQDIFIVPVSHHSVHHEYIAHDILTLNLFSNQYSFELIQRDAIINLHEKNKYFIDADKLEFPVKLRYWKLGDRFNMMGTSYYKKLSDIFIDKKVPIHRKQRILLLVNA